MKISQCCRHYDKRVLKVKRKKRVYITLPHKCNCKYCPVGKPKGILKKRKSVTFKKSCSGAYKQLKRMAPEKRKRGSVVCSWECMVQNDRRRKRKRKKTVPQGQ
ncbi:unnamed protein product [Nezara viridula]|uniref:Uncharacterized protein n=1 Tax=Nezara viridula TaxID=85310 RepID=A0A9P0E7G3_NEZVI|nr:unnamed protein product [Nezara viridula]